MPGLLLDGLVEAFVMPLTAAHIASLDQLKAKAPFAPNIGLGAVAPDASGLCGQAR